MLENMNERRAENRDSNGAVELNTNKTLLQWQ